MENKIITITNEQFDRADEILKAKLLKPGMEDYLKDSELYDILYQEVVSDVVRWDNLNQGRY